MVCPVAVTTYWHVHNCLFLQLCDCLWQWYHDVYLRCLSVHQISGQCICVLRQLSHVNENNEEKE